MLSTAQRRLLRRVLSALDGYRLARKAVVGQRGAAFVARVQCDRCSARVRRALAASGWTRSLCAWMHGLLLTKLGKETLPLYLEVVQVGGQVPGATRKPVLLAGGLSDLAQGLFNAWKSAFDDNESPRVCSARLS